MKQSFFRTRQSFGIQRSQASYSLILAPGPDLDRSSSSSSICFCESSA